MEYTLTDSSKLTMAQAVEELFKLLKLFDRLPSDFEPLTMAFRRTLNRDWAITVMETSLCPVQ